MTEFELQQYLLREFPQENARCEWNVFDKPNERVEIANMEGGFLVVGVHKIFV